MQLCIEWLCYKILEIRPRPGIISYLLYIDIDGINTICIYVGYLDSYGRRSQTWDGPGGSSYGWGRTEKNKIIREYGQGIYPCTQFIFMIWVMLYFMVVIQMKKKLEVSEMVIVIVEGEKLYHQVS